MSRMKLLYIRFLRISINDIHGSFSIYIVLINVKEFKFDLFSPVQGDLFRLKWGVGAGLVDTALTRAEIKNCK